MKLQNVLNVNAILALAIGIAFIVYSPNVIAYFGLPDLPEGDILLFWNAVSFARMFGAALFAYGLLLWALRTSVLRGTIKAENHRSLLFALVLSNLLAALVALTQQTGVWVTGVGWALFAFFTIFFLSYAVLMRGVGQE